MMLLILGAVVLIGIIYYKYVIPLRYWKDRGVEQGKPILIFGHFLENFFGKMNFCDVLQKVYDQSPNARYTGMYQFSKPVLVVRDPDLIKQILVKDFDSFLDHPEFIPDGADPMWSKNLLNLKGSKWKDMRTSLSPSFTASKMRLMFDLMKECADVLVQHILNKNQEIVTEEVKDIFSRFANDVIATTAYGIKVDSLDQPENEFYEMGKDVADFNSFSNILKPLLYQMLPIVKYFIKIQMFSDKATSYFRGIIDDAIAAREEKGVVRPDMLQLLLQARGTVKKFGEEDSGVQAKKNSSTSPLKLTNDDITAQAMIFFLAGFESVSSFVSFAAYELAINQDVQEKLREEVKRTLEECGGDVTYDAIFKMKYMDMVISESLRKWPSFVGTDRVCTKSYTIEPVNPGEQSLHIEKGTEVVIPLYAIQHDPKYFPNPEKFDPERFSEDNKDKSQYLTFGLGPRICIGSRFAIMEGKILLFQILTNFEIVPVKETMIPLKFVKYSFTLQPVNGFWLGFKKSKI